jgi:hypothetical protein
MRAAATGRPARASGDRVISQIAGAVCVLRPTWEIHIPQTGDQFNPILHAPLSDADFRTTQVVGEVYGPAITFASDTASEQDTIKAAVVLRSTLTAAETGTLISLPPSARDGHE